MQATTCYNKGPYESIVNVFKFYAINDLILQKSCALLRYGRLQKISPKYRYKFKFQKISMESDYDTDLVGLDRIITI